MRNSITVRRVKPPAANRCIATVLVDRILAQLLAPLVVALHPPVMDAVLQGVAFAQQMVGNLGKIRVTAIHTHLAAVSSVRRAISITPRGVRTSAACTGVETVLLA